MDELTIRPFPAGGWSVYKNGRLAAEVATLALALETLAALRDQLAPGTNATSERDLNAGD
jgi:outer membrane murein-binding lipoprotein Lpp